MFGNSGCDVSPRELYCSSRLSRWWFAALLFILAGLLPLHAGPLTVIIGGYIPERGTRGTSEGVCYWLNEQCGILAHPYGEKNRCEATAIAVQRDKIFLGGWATNESRPSTWRSSPLTPSATCCC